MINKLFQYFIFSWSKNYNHNFECQKAKIKKIKVLMELHLADIQELLNMY
jgi:hypothetical protein